MQMLQGKNPCLEKEKVRVLINYLRFKLAEAKKSTQLPPELKRWCQMASEDHSPHFSSLQVKILFKTCFIIILRLSLFSILKKLEIRMTILKLNSETF
jgi:hypothetical protein